MKINGWLKQEARDAGDKEKGPRGAESVGAEAGTSPKGSCAHDLQGHPADGLVDVKVLLALSRSRHAQQEQVRSLVHQR